MSATPPLQRLAAYVRAAMAQAGYTYEEGRRTGDLQRLADATKQAAHRLGGNFTSMDTASLGRLLRGERMPRPTSLYPLADALGVDYRDLMVEAGIIPPEALGTPTRTRVRSRPTPDDVAEAWGIKDDAGRAVVRAMHDRLATKTDDDTDATNTDGSAEAQG